MIDLPIWQIRPGSHLKFQNFKVKIQTVHGQKMIDRPDQDLT